MVVSQTFLIVVLALSSAFLFALSDQLAHRAMATVDTRSGAVVSVAATAVFFWLFAP